MAENNDDSCSTCSPHNHKTDWLLYGSSLIIIIGYALHYFIGDALIAVPYLPSFVESVFQLLNKMWWGIALGIIFVGVLAGVPKELVSSILGKGGTLGGIIRATIAGVLLDLCSHGILLVGMQLYKKGASLGQTMAFLIASPWNSLSLTLILWSLVGLKWTLGILGLSLLIAIVSGLIFELLVKVKVLSANPNRNDLEISHGFIKESKKYLFNISWTPSTFSKTLKTGVMESKMILRWIFFGIVLAALIRTFVSTELFSTLFGPTIAGLGATLIFATILEVCSEGSMPIAADMLTRAGAPGNSFAFLMTGVSTDYTEILSLKETTRSWKTSLFLPLVTVPQVVALAFILNQYTY